VPRPISTVGSAEAERKRTLLLDATAAEAVVASSPATVRWLLCGRGRPVSTTGPEADYSVLLTRDRAVVVHPDIESSRVEAEERFDELGFETVTYPWHEGRARTLRELLGGARPLTAGELDSAAAPLRRHLGEEELRRYRAAGADAAEAMVETLAALSPAETEVEAAAGLGRRLRQRGFTTPVLLAAGEDRQGIHRIPSRRARRSAGTPSWRRRLSDTGCTSRSRGSRPSGARPRSWSICAVAPRRSTRSRCAARARDGRSATCSPTSRPPTRTRDSPVSGDATTRAA
jgi:hypothetical protein